ncbi:MAG: helix-turn-helix domain-containing protein [Parahaliea sp.]
MPAPTLVHLTAEEKALLEKNLRSGKTPVRLRERSEIVLLAAKGIPNYLIARQTGININKVGRWRNRYAEAGYSGIEKDKPRGGNHGGKEASAQSELRSRIISKTTTEKPEGETHWSTRSLAKV